MSSHFELFFWVHLVAYLDTVIYFVHQKKESEITRNSDDRRIQNDFERQLAERN